MSAAHTPGPWEVSESNSCRVQCSSRGELIAGAYAPEKPREENIANARLIAAAPQLAEALRGMLSDWCDHFGEGACDCPIEPYNAGQVCNCCLARAALTAAGVTTP